MKLLILPVIALLLGACVSLDVSSMNTAEPLGKNKFRAGVSTGMGANLTDIASGEQFNDPNFPQNLNMPGAIIGSAKVAWGVSDDSDLGLETWIGGSSAGHRVQFKQVLSRPSPEEATAVIPGLMVSYSGSGTTGLDKASFIPDDNFAVGGEIQLLKTRKFSNFVRGTLHAQTGSYLLRGYVPVLERYDFTNISRLGGGANLKFDLKPVYLMLEAGGYLFYSTRGGISVLPYTQVGIGFN